MFEPVCETAKSCNLTCASFWLSGAVPTQIGLLTELTELLLGDNQLDGQYFASAAFFSKLATKRNAYYFRTSVRDG